MIYYILKLRKSEMTEEENYGYILRISEDDWEKQIFEIKNTIRQ